MDRTSAGLVPVWAIAPTMDVIDATTTAAHVSTFTIGFVMLM
jgi:hypothetical protein